MAQPASNATLSVGGGAACSKSRRKPSAEHPLRQRRPQPWDTKALRGFRVLAVAAFAASSAPQAVEAGDFFRSLSKAKIKPPARLLEEGKVLARTVSAVAEKHEDAGKVVDEIQRAAGNDLGKVTAGIGNVIASSPKDFEKVEGAIERATPKIAEVLSSTDPERIAEVLKAADPKEIENIFDAVGEFEYWKQRWYEPFAALLVLYIALNCSWRVLCRRCKRRKHACVVLENSDQGLLEVEAPPSTGMFSRSAHPPTL